MSTLTLTLPLSMTLRRRRHRAATPNAPDADAASAACEAPSASQAEGPKTHGRCSPGRADSTVRALRKLQKAVRHGWVGEIDMALNLSLNALGDADAESRANEAAEVTAPMHAEMAQTCAGCHAPNAATARYCNQCGTSLAPAQASAGNPPDAEPSPEVQP